MADEPPRKRSVKDIVVFLLAYFISAALIISPMSSLVHEAEGAVAKFAIQMTGFAICFLMAGIAMLLASKFSKN